MKRSIHPRKILAHGADRWLVHIPKDLQSPNSKKDRTFESARIAAEYAKQLAKERLKPIPNEFNKYPAFEQSEALRWLAEKRRAQSLTVSEAAEKCLQFKTEAGKCRGSLVAAKCAFRSLGKMIGAKAIQSVASDDISAWLSSHAEWSMKTKLNNYKQASSLFNWCVKTNRLQRNPCVGVEQPKVPFKGVSILSVTDIKNILWAIQKNDPALIGFVALVLFGGLRVTESARCVAGNLVGGVIDLGGAQTKLNLRRCVKISPQIAAWLAVPGVEIGGKKLHQRMNAMANMAGVKLTKNCLRHSFCSYSYPLVGAAATARAANNSETMLSRHYLGLVTDEDAKAFAEIFPT